MSSVFIRKESFVKRSDHVTNIKAELAAKIADDPNLLWRSHPCRSNDISALKIPESEWLAHFSAQFKAPDSLLAKTFNDEIRSFLNS